MADEAQDLEVENILSSIKDILEEDEDNGKTEPLSPQPESENSVLDDVLSEDLDDDILELSEDMRIEPQTENVVEAVAEPVVEETPEPEVIAQVEAVAEPVVEETPEPEVVAQVEAVAEPVVEETPEPEVIAQVEAVAEPVVEEMSNEEKAIDASANIISNFAKMFSKDKDEQSEPKQQVTGLGNASYTLEDFVKEAIVKVIGEDIAKQWNDGAEYRVMAEAEIKKQVQAWVNDNLPKMVEKIVKDEMERVTAKVGS